MRIYTANHKPNFDVAEELERRIRQRERSIVRELRTHPDFGMARTVAYCRRIHTESIARSNADKRSRGDE
jgi:hypothetical protein